MISTHVLDTSAGVPASEVRVTLEIRSGDDWRSLGTTATDAEGRVRELLPSGVPLAAGRYRLHFDTGAYFTSRGVNAFYPSITVEFEVSRPTQHHHVPLLLSPFGYSTYRGS